MKVPIVQLELPEDVLNDAKEVLKSGMWAAGKPVHQLEEEFANYCGAKYCKAVNNGTAALLAIFNSLQLKPGDEVIIPSFSFIATANCLLPFGLKPVFADIERNSYNISIDSIKDKITEKTKAIMPVHLYGLCADMTEIAEIATVRGIHVIEDACQAHGAELNGIKAGNLGEIAAFSLYPTKNMFCGGEGGLITTNNEKFYESVRLFADHGQSKKYHHTQLGYNFRMGSVNGLIASYSLKILDDNIIKRNENARIYNELLSDTKGIALPIHPENKKHVYHQYTIRTTKRDKLIEVLRKEQIGFGIHYQIPIHMQDYYINKGYKISLPETEKACREVLSLPVHSLLHEEQIKFVAETIRKFH
jgi:dTDP-4-amino-4,6-dideoxygalactose transaminase